MAKRKRKEPPKSGEYGGSPLTIGELQQVMSALGAAGAVLLEAANLIEEVVGSSNAAAIEKLQSLEGSWRIAFRADALADDVLAMLPGVAERLETDELPSWPAAS